GIGAHGGHEIAEEQRDLPAVQAFFGEGAKEAGETHDSSQGTGGHEEDLHQVFEDVPEERSAHAGAPMLDVMWKGFGEFMEKGNVTAFSQSTEGQRGIRDAGLIRTSARFDSAHRRR